MLKNWSSVFAVLFNIKKPVKDNWYKKMYILPSGYNMIQYDNNNTCSWIYHIAETIWRRNVW